MLKVRAGRTQYEVYAFDVESHNDDETIAKEETSIWLYSFINDESQIDDESSYGYTIDDFINRLDDLSKPYRSEKRSRKKRNVLIYVWNLAFEWSFLLPRLLDHGFKWKEKIEKDDEYCFTSVTNKSCSSVWCATLKFSKKGGTILFKDMMKILTGSLRKVAESYGLPTQKSDIDYRLNRLHGHIVTKEEKEYCFKDTRIIIDLALRMHKENDKDFFSSVSAATYSCRKMIHAGYPRKLKPMKAFREEYPELDTEESEFLRKGVAGGITYAPKKWQFKDIKKNIKHIDMHQAHPTSAFLNVFPFGKGTYFKGNPPKDHFYICACRIKISYFDVKLHSIIQLIGYDIAREQELVVWDFEIGLMKKCYVDLEIEYIDGYAYRTRLLPWRKYYDDNYKLRVKAKRQKDGFHTMQYKLLNNSAYGKLLERGHDFTLENIINDSGIIDSVVIEKKNANINAQYTYIPVGSCIPAYTRVRLISTALKLGWENIVYFDTDSIFFIDNDYTREAVKKINFKDELGGWGWEYDIKRAMFTAPKRYKLIEKAKDEKGNPKDKLTAHLAGVNFRHELDVEYFDDLNIVDGDYTIQGVKRVKGGTIIVFKNKSLQVQKKYQHIANMNLKAYNKSGK